MKRAPAPIAMNNEAVFATFYLLAVFLRLNWLISARERLESSRDELLSLPKLVEVTASVFSILIFGGLGYPHFCASSEYKPFLSLEKYK